MESLITELLIFIKYQINSAVLKRYLKLQKGFRYVPYLEILVSC